MLIKDLYEIKSINALSSSEHNACIHFNKEHAIFKGHFPGKPIVPGVCMLQIVKEITASIVNQKLALKSSSNIKFMALINPNETPDLKLNFIIEKTENEIKVKNASYFGETLAVKMSVTYQVL